MKRFSEWLKRLFHPLKCPRCGLVEPLVYYNGREMCGRCWAASHQEVERLLWQASAVRCMRDHCSSRRIS